MLTSKILESGYFTGFVSDDLKVDLNIPSFNEAQKLGSELKSSKSMRISELETQLGSLKTEIWLTTEEAAQYLKLSVGTLRNMTSNGRLPFYKCLGTNRNRYLQSELKELLLAQKRGK